MSRIYLTSLVCCLLALAIPRFLAQQSAVLPRPPENLNLYLLIGLIVNAHDGAKIDEWLGKSELYWGARKRTKAAMRLGTLKGVLWHQGESDSKTADDYLDKLQTIVGNLRADLNDPNLPFISGQIHKGPTINAHAYWWRQLQNGTCDRQLQEHPNLYADMSGHVVVQVFNRDRKYAREFLIRNQDKILWATDEGWWSFGKAGSEMNQHYTFFEELDLPDEVRHKIYRGNALKVYGLK